jgi:hypothetical protein
MERIVDETVDVTEKIHVPIEKKMNLTIKEAAEYSNIGINKIAEMLERQEPDHGSAQSPSGFEL